MYYGCLVMTACSGKNESAGSGYSGTHSEEEYDELIKERDNYKEKAEKYKDEVKKIESELKDALEENEKLLQKLGETTVVKEKEENDSEDKGIIDLIAENSEDSRLRDDTMNYDSIISCCMVAFASPKVYAEALGEIILQAGDGVKAPREWTISSGEGGHENFENEMNKILGENWKEKLAVSVTNSVGVNSSGEFDENHCVYTITITNGSINRTWAPGKRSE